MISLRDGVERFDRFFLRADAAAPLALFRLLFGVCVFVAVTASLSDYDYWVGPTSIVTPEVNRRFTGPTEFSFFALVAPTSTSWILFLVSLLGASLVLIVSSLTERLWWIPLAPMGRLACVWIYIGFMTFSTEWPMVLNGGDALMRITSFLLLFSPSVALMSRDPASVWAKRLIQVQISVLYLSTSLWKIQGVKWQDGTAAFWSIQFPSLKRFEENLIFTTPDWAQEVLARVGTWGAFGIEFLFCFLICFRETRRVMLGLTVLLHLGIAITMRLAFFECVMICHLALFLTHEEVRWLIKKMTFGRVDIDTKADGLVQEEPHASALGTFPSERVVGQGEAL